MVERTGAWMTWPWIDHNRTLHDLCPLQLGKLCVLSENFSCATFA
ncbi:hypothetical protein CFter6_0695 [Collimonas fungivorans]|uniref:Uncharacterized protein n=1 Tax=Collimonas fungivorans TaxID=158899 RepID=A0A127P6I3_9BURK|nr:hypothetical protein CFter6_0695 [Collimonas fungivorans]